MKLDLFYEFCQGAPRPWAVGADRDLYDQVLEQAEVADAAGFNCFWSVEHHGSVEVTHMPAPECFLTAVAMRTRKMRIGHAVALTPTPFNNPIRLAERAAVLDNLSHGRLEMGFGRSTPREWAVFNVAADDTRGMLQEALTLIPRLWTEENVTFAGHYTQVPSFTLVPRVLQQPHPPMWIAATSPESFKMAGHMGIGVAGLTLSLPVSDLAERLKLYREAARDVTPVGRAINTRTAAFTYVYCAETEREAIHDGAPQAAAWYLSKVSAYYSQTAVTNDEGGKDFVFRPEDRIRLIKERGETPASVVLLKLAQQHEVSAEEFYEAMSYENQCIIGTPDQVIKKMEQYEDIGLDHLMCLIQGGPSLPHEKIIKSIKLLGDKVLPYFHNRN